MIIFQIAENFRKQLQINQKSKNQSIKEVFQPAGEESHRVDRLNLTYEDKLQTTLSRFFFLLWIVFYLNMLQGDLIWLNWMEF